MSRTVTLAAAALALAAGLIVAPPVSADEPAVAVGDCLVTPADAVWDPKSEVAPADCTGLHNLEVAYVGTYPEDLPAPSEASYESLYDAQDTMCPYDKVSYYDTAPGITIVLMTGHTFKVPTDAEWQAGDRTVRCVVLVFGLKGTGQSWSGSLPELLKAGKVLPFLGCATAKPSIISTWEYGKCTKPSQWLILKGAPIKATATAKPFPGAKVIAEAKAICGKLAKSFTKKGIKVTFMSPVQPKKYWDQGAHFVDCLIPYGNWSGKI